MTEYAICFDFPESDEPCFAHMLAEGIGYTWLLPIALRFNNEEDAHRTLENAFCEEMRSFGTVVEIGQ